MAKKYIDNHKLNIAIEILLNSLDYTEKCSIHNVIKLESGDYLPKHQMKDGNHHVYGGGGKTENNHNEFNIDFETIGIGRVGARCGCVFTIEEKSWVTDNALYVKEYDKRFTLKYLKHFLNYSNLNKYANDSMQPVISKIGIQSIEIPLLSYEKQVELGAFLDELEKGNFSRLNDYPIIKDKFNILDKIENFQTEKQTQLISQLRQSILQEAIQGKLTAEWREQNPNIEPATELLKRIKTEKEQLIKEKKIKREKPISPISKDEIPFELPQGWVWCRLEEICEIIMGQSPDGNSVNSLGNGIEFHQGKIFFTEKIIAKSNQTTQQITKTASKDSILLCVRAPVGKVNISDRNICIGRGLCALKVNPFMGFLFLFYAISILEKTFVSKAKGSIFTAISLDIVKNEIIPLPSIPEQQAIVNKIEILLEKCNQLQEEIKNQNKHGKELLKALFNETFGETK